MSKKITIAIDGFSSTGKSTLAKQLAGFLGYVYVDTGAMYRAVTYFAMQNGLITENGPDSDNLTRKLSELQLEFRFNPESGYGEMYLNGVNVEREIRSLEVSRWVSEIARISAVRAALVERQKKMGKDKGVVMDGRDIGTVVFPDAELKIFMTASAATRAERRYKELLAKGEKITYEAVYENVVSRDKMDTERSDSPLKKAQDAIELDNSGLSIDEQFQKVLEYAREAIEKA